MCGYDGETPSIVWDITLKARKEHTCCECLSVISIGETYHLTKGIWGGEFEQFRTCEICHMVKAEAYSSGNLRHDEGIAFGCLWEIVGVEYEVGACQ